MDKQNNSIDKKLKLARYNHLRDEMDKLVGPLYEKMNDKQIFPFNKDGPIDFGPLIKKQCVEFFDKISRYQYLNQSPALEEKINEYRKVIDGEERTAYVGIGTNLIKTIKRRYKELGDEIRSVEKELELLK